MKYNLLIILILLSTLVSGRIQACTGVFASDSTQAQFGNNEDYSDPATYIWTRSGAGAYDRVYVGYGNFWPQGGMNERGLCFDGFATVYNPVEPDTSLPELFGDYVDVMLSSFSTVTEVADYLLAHSRTTMANYQLFFADSSGNSLIAEGDSLVWIDGDWQVCTNFYHTEPELGGWPCWRYQTAVQMLESMDQLDSDYIRDILDACHVGFTQYSNIFDLRLKTLRMFHQGDYSMDVQLSFDQIMQEITAPMRISELVSMASVEDDPTVAPLPKSFGLLQNYPNPFNPSTKITFDLPGNVGEELDVTLVIFDIGGRRVRGLIDSGLEAGRHRVQWDGRNDMGEPVPSGVYLCTMKAGDEKFIRKVTLVK